MHVQLIPISCLSLCLWVGMACEPPLETREDIPASTEAGDALLAQLIGEWRIEGAFSSTCPEEWQTHFPQGETRWVEDGGQLCIEDLDGAQPSLCFWPEDEKTLVKSVTLTKGDCLGEQAQTLSLTHISETTIQGSFTAALALEAGQLCPLNEESEDFPCLSEFTWMALRR